MGVALAALGVTLAVAAPARAQSEGNGFLFKTPHGSVTILGGYNHAFAQSDLFSFTKSELTVNTGDFSAFTLGADVAVRLSPRFDVVLGSAYAGTSTPSEFREFVDQNNAPIQQTTTFQRVPITASLRLYLTPRGRSVGRFAWVPASFTPYVDVGGGAMWYRFKQQGDFVDQNTMNVFTDTFSSSGFTPEAHATLGTEYSLSPRFAITGEARYTWAKARPGSDFAGFDKIDLSGIAATAGLAVRF